MDDDTTESAVERGLNAYFAGDTVKDLLAAIDIDALAEGAAFDDAVEYEQFGKIIGALVGRAAAKGVSNSSLVGRVVKESVGSEIGGRVGKAAVAAAVEYVDLDVLIEQVQNSSNAGRLDALVDTVGELVANSNDRLASAGDAANTPADWTDIDVEEAADE